MAELLEAVVSWPGLLLVLLVFGFAPGFCLRLIVLAYPRGDPRRAELIAELYAVPRIERPLWVAEQLEVALFEGLAHRVSTVIRRLTSRGRTRRSTLASWAGLLALLAGQAWLAVVLVPQSLARANAWASVLGAGMAFAAALLMLVAWQLKRSLGDPDRARTHNERAHRSRGDRA